MSDYTIVTTRDSYYLNKDWYKEERSNHVRRREAMYEGLFSGIDEVAKCFVCHWAGRTKSQTSHWVVLLQTNPLWTVGNLRFLSWIKRACYHIHNNASILCPCKTSVKLSWTHSAYWERVLWNIDRTPTTNLPKFIILNGHGHDLSQLKNLLF